MDMAPVVRALRLAQDEAARADPDDADTDAAGPDAAGPDAAERGHHRDGPDLPEPALDGIRDGLPRSLELARTRGLGLIGDGAPAAARALLVSLLAARHRPVAEPAAGSAAGPAGPVEVLIPADVLAAVLPGISDRPGQPLPTRLRTTRDLDTALDVAETELVTRARLTAERRAGLGTLVLLAVPQPHAERRLQAVLDNGSTLGIAGVLLGQWRPGGTLRLRPDGTVAAASPDIAAALDRTRLFTLPTDSTRTLLDLLAAADAPAADREAVRTDATDPDDTVELTDTETDSEAGDDRSGGADPAEIDHPDTGSRTFTRSDAAAATTAPPVDRAASVTVLRRVPAGQTLAPRPPGPVSADPDGMDLELAHAVGGAGTDPPGPPAPPPPATSGHRPWAEVRPTPARAAVHGTAGEPVPRARATAPLRLTVLGRLHLHHLTPDRRRSTTGPGIDVIAALAPRQREVLVYLALHPDGARRESLAAAIWPDAPAERPYNSFHATLSQLRKALSKATGDTTSHLVVHGDGRYQLDGDLLDVDLWHLNDALAAARGAAPDRLDALRQVPDLYPGDLAEDLTADWLTARRESLRRQVLDALSTLIHSAPQDPRQVLGWLEHARALDPYNEAIYRDLIRTQSRLGRHDAITRTLSLLTATLAEIDRQPAPDTLALAERLSQSGTTQPTP